MTVPIGSYHIEIPTTNPLSFHYLAEPNCNSQLGRLTRIVKRKYPQVCAIDVGANVGDTACVIKSAENIPLICIEGDQYSFAFLMKNTAQFANTYVYNMFLGEETSSIKAEVHKDGWNTTIKPGAGATASEIQLTSLDDFIEKHEQFEAMKLLKVDTEGFDFPIIRGGRGFIKKVAPVIAFEYNRGNMDAIHEKGLDTLEMLQLLGYSRIVFHDPTGRFLLSSTLDQRSLLKDLHEYADGQRGHICYYDITLFHGSDDDLAGQYVQGERYFRNAGHVV